MPQNKIIPKDFNHAVDIIQSLLSKESIDTLIETDAYCHFGIGLFIRNQILYLENPYWKISNADNISESIYHELMNRIKAEKFFSKRELKNFFKEPKKYASALCLNDTNYLRESSDFRGYRARVYTNEEVLFSKDRSNNAFLFSTNTLFHFDNVYEYSLDGDMLSVSWGVHKSLFKLYEDFNFDFKIKKRDKIAKKLYKIIDLSHKEFYSRDNSFGFKVWGRSKTEDSKPVIKIDDIKDSLLREYFHNQDIPLDIWEHTIFMKCFNINPDYEIKDDIFNIDISTNLPFWLSEYEDKQLTEVLALWKKAQCPSNHHLENIEEVKSLTDQSTLEKVIKSTKYNYNIEVLKNISKVYKQKPNLSNIRFIKNLYSMLYSSLKMEKYFSKERVEAFRKDDKAHANAKCISYKCTSKYQSAYRTSLNSYEDKYVLLRLDKTKEVFSILFISSCLWIDFSEYKYINNYSIKENILTISYDDVESVFELLEDV